MHRIKYQLKHVLTQSPVVEMLTVRSYEMNIYLVELRVGDEMGLVYEGDRPKRFHSTQHVRDTFDSCIILAAQMLHESPYDEMIGNPESAQNLGALPFSMGQPY